jgi:DNA-binding SARP family transcriptional activator
MALTFQLLGPIDAHRNGQSLPLSGPRRRALLARLLVARGQLVTADQLVDDVWDGQPSAAARATLQSHVSQLRKVLGDRLRSHGRAYLLDLSGASLDAAEFETLADRGAAQLSIGEAGVAHAAFEAALALWRGHALEEVADRAWAAPEAARLEDRRAMVVEDDLKALLELGRHADVVHLAEAAVANEPLREQRWVYLIVAMYRCSRQADALAAARRVRDLLADELGIDPSPQLASVELAVLNQDPTLLGVSEPPAGPTAVDQAREATRRGRWSDATHLLEAADTPLRPLGPEALEWLGQVAYMAGRMELAIRANQRAHSAWLEQGARGRAVIPAMALVANHFVHNHPAIAIGWFQRGRRLLEGQPQGPEHGVVALTACLIALATGDLAAASAAAAQAREIGARFHVPDVEALSLTLQGVVLLRCGAIADGIALLDEALTFLAADQLGPMSTAQIFCKSLQALVDVADLERASQWIDTITARSADGLNGGFPGDCRVHKAEVLCGLGRWDEAEQEARAACKEVQAVDLLHAGVAYAQLGTAQLAQGDLSAAGTSFAHAVACGVSAQPGLAQLHLAQGDPVAAATSIRAALADSRLDAPTRGRLLSAAVDITLAAEDAVAAEQAGAELQQLAERYATPVLQASAATARASLALHRGDPALAVTLLREASRIWLRLHAPGQLARVRRRMAEALDALGDHSGAALERAAARITTRSRA